MPVSLTTVALPVGPVVLTAMAPVTASLSATMSALLAVVVNDAVPSTFTRAAAAPLMVMPVAPPLVTLRLPVMSMSAATSVTFAVVKSSVRLRRLVVPASEGSAAAAWMLVSARSRMRAFWFRVMAPAMLLPALPSRMSELLAPTSSVVVPPTVSVAPLAWVMWVPEVTDRLPPTDDVPNSTSWAFTTTTSALVPLVLTEMVPATSS